MTPHWGIFAGFFLCVLGSVAAAGYFLIWRKQDDAGAGAGAGITVEPSSGESIKSLLLSMFRPLGESLPRPEAQGKGVEQQLAYAGYRFPSAVTLFFGLKWGIGFLVASLLAIVAAYNRSDGTMSFAAAICGLGFGFLVPDRILEHAIKSRNERLRRAIPAALDLIIMALEAGQTLDQAMHAASKGLRALFPDLANELLQVHFQIRASRSRSDCLREMASRNNEPELRKLCSLLVESDRFGTSLAPTLRQHTRYLRIRFRQTAQESARKLTVKMVFPVFFLIFPSILVVTLGPAVLTLTKYLKVMMQ